LPGGQHSPVSADVLQARWGLGSGLGCCNLVLLLASKLCPVELLFLKIRQVWKEAAVILGGGVNGQQSGAW